MDDLLRMLKGGDPRSIGRVDEVVAYVLETTAAFNRLFVRLTDADPVVRMRSADAIEKITSSRPELLQPYKMNLLDEIAMIDQQEVRWHVAQMIPRLVLNPDEREQAVAILFEYLSDDSKIVQVSAMQSLVDLAEDDAILREQVIPRITVLLQTGSPAVQNRGRKLLIHLKEKKQSGD